MSFAGNMKSILMTWPPIMGMSFFAGLCAVFLPWWINVGLAALGIYTAVLWLTPWAGMFLYILIVMFAPDFKIADVATVFTLLIFSAQILRSKPHNFQFPREIFFPLIAFTACIVISFVLSVLYFHNLVPYIYRDGRAFIYWLWIPLLWHLIANDPDAMIKLARMIFAIALVVALMALFEASTGMQLVAIGRVGALDTAGVSQNEFTRVQMPGFLFVTWAIVWLSLSLLYRNINSAVGALLLSIFAAALFVNFGRALWVWTFFAVITPIFFIEKRRATKFVMALFTILVLATAVLAVVRPSILDAVTVRLLSIKDEGGKHTSYGWREWENQDALATLKRTPVVGVGIGGEYRPWIRMLSIFPEHTRYIHNSYLYLALKIGIPGLLCLLWLFWRSWNRARRAVSLIDKKHSLTALASIAFLPAAMGLNLTQPELMSNYSIILLASIIALFASRVFDVKLSSLGTSENNNQNYKLKIT